MIDTLLINRKTLPNGIRLIQVPRSQKMTAQFSVAIEYGSKPSSEKNVGLAHFLEHMIGGGSKNRIGATRVIEQNGGYQNFWTSPEFTMGYVDVFAKKLKHSSQILSKLFFEDDFEEKKFKLEKKVILNEINDSLDNPLDVVDDILKKNLFPTHPIRHPILGYPDTVSQFSLEKIIATQQAHYTPQNTIVILSGKYSEKDVVWIEQEFAKIKKSKTVSKKYEHVEERDPKRIASKKKMGITQTYLRFGYRTTSWKHPDNPAMELFSTIMGNGSSSRLFRELREKRGLAYDIQSSNCKGQDFGFFSIECSVKASNIKETTDLILKEITNMKIEKISDNELLKAKKMITGDYYRGIDESETLHTMINYFETFFADEYAIKKYLEKIKTVSTDDLIEIANKYLREDNLSKAVLTP